MNQNDWVEYFEAVNGRKPSMQEFQEAREKGEFVVERKEAPTPTTEAPIWGCLLKLKRDLFGLGTGCKVFADGCGWTEVGCSWERGALGATGPS